ncbi:threonyl-tRNA synthetase editing domain-containing protein [Halomicrococcus gelatinilyticus]|uniref:threonyl-tRNA synthetase editing domain-containing protein n=1 Tax=Halomicrococcus gelatinilyticus TaxID=1702103 RepID=UPI002E10075F
MRLLAMHAERFSFAAETPVDETPAESTTGTAAADAEEGAAPSDATPPTSADLDDCVVAVVGVERSDATRQDAVAAAAADECRDVADQLGEDVVALVPGGHLVDCPADDRDAAAVLSSLADALAGSVTVVRAPVGWHLACDLRKRGHPFAAQTRRVTPARRDPSTEAWYVRLPGGDRVQLDDADAELPDAWAATAEQVAAEPTDSTRNLPRNRLAEAGLVAEGDAADGLGWLPRGSLVRDALRAHAADRVAAAGVPTVETPACDGPLATAPSSIGADDRPWRRAELAGEAPEVVAAVDPERAEREVLRGVRLVSGTLAPLALEFLAVLRASGDRADALAADLAAALDGPLLVARHGDADRGPSVEFVPVGASWAGEPPRVEYDATAAARRDVTLADGRRPAVVRTVPFGDLASAVAAAIEHAAERAPPRLPTWLAPTQVRFVPVGDDHVDRCDGLAADLWEAGVRADVDAREVPVGERIERAADDWVPYYAVVGDPEMGDDAFPVTDRTAREQRETTVTALAETVATADRPRLRAHIPDRVPDASG